MRLKTIQVWRRFDFEPVVINEVDYDDFFYSLDELRKPVRKKKSKVDSVDTGVQVVIQRDGDD